MNLCESTLRRVVKMVVLTTFLIKFGPLLLGILSTPTSGISVIASAGCLSRIPKAIEAVREERQRTEVERDAFERFAIEVRNLNAADTPALDRNEPLLRDHTPAVVDSTGTVRALYRETIMSIEHYEKEYDEPMYTNITAELGPDFETALSSNGTLNKPLQEALVRRGYSVAQARKDFFNRVNSEHQSLTDAKEQLGNVTETVEQMQSQEFGTRSPVNVENAVEELQAAERGCRSIIDSRQSEYVNTHKEDGLSFREYLYQQFEWAHPVIGDALDLVRDIRDAEERIMSIVSSESGRE